MPRPEERVPLIHRDICAECGEPIYTGEARGTNWFTCRFCRKTICVDCLKKHVPLCMALAWGLARIDPKTGELVKEERPITLAW